MGVQIVEHVTSREWSTDGSVSFKYILTGTSDDYTARTLLLGSTPVTYNDLVRDPNPTLEPRWADADHGDGKWDCTVRFAPAAEIEPEAGDWSISFDTTGGTQHVTQSLSTIGKYAPAGQTPPDFQGAIGVADGKVEGADITVPVYTWSETHHKTPEEVTQAYRGTLFRLTGKVNVSAFKGTEAGETLFLGANGSRREGEPWEITYNFASSPNVADKTVGDITGIAKKGWEYLWILYETAEDAAAKKLVAQPVAVYVERVYEDGNLGDLDIGT